jgi:hypothetical protein
MLSGSLTPSLSHTPPPTIPPELLSSHFVLSTILPTPLPSLLPMLVPIKSLNVLIFSLSRLAPGLTPFQSIASNMPSFLLTLLPPSLLPVAVHQNPSCLPLLLHALPHLVPSLSPFPCLFPPGLTAIPAHQPDLTISFCRKSGGDVSDDVIELIIIGRRYILC